MSASLEIGAVLYPAGDENPAIDLQDLCVVQVVLRDAGLEVERRAKLILTRQWGPVGQSQGSLHQLGHFWMEINRLGRLATNALAGFWAEAVWSHKRSLASERRACETMWAEHAGALQACENLSQQERERFEAREVGKNASRTASGRSSD